jgi:acid phosphatase
MPRIRHFCFLSAALAWAGCTSDSDNPNPATTGAGGTSQSDGGQGDGATGTGGSGGTGGTGPDASADSNGTGGATGDGATGMDGMTQGDGTTEGGDSGGSDQLKTDVQTIVFIYAENRSFDGLFGNFPGAHGLSDVIDAQGAPKTSYVAQKDRDGATVLAKLPQTWGGVTAAGNPTVVTQAQSDNLPNAPFSIETAFSGGDAGMTLTTADVTRDMAHRFFENTMEINGGTNDMFAAWLDAGGLTMGHFDYSQSKLYKLAKDYVLADNFFQAAYGGSFLNHQYLICACAPSVPASFVANNNPSLNVLGTPNGKGVPQLATNSTSPASALDGAPSFKTGNIAPLDYFGAGDGYRAVNTMQPPYQPSGNFPAMGATDLRYANPTGATTLPAQTQATIGSLLTDKSVTWAWYATSWTAATTDGQQAAGSTHAVIYAPSTPKGNPDFQPHHHPFNFYEAFDPGTHAAYRTAHLKDYTDLVTDITNGTLPSVVFYKPTGYVNQHPGYANADDGDAHIADLVNKLQSGSQWAHMVIVITYDEYGGQWDHVAPPKGDLVGPGTRIPAIIVSPFAKKGTVDHTQYDTASILRLITRRFSLDTLAGLKARDQALVSQGGQAMGDLTNALTLP